MFRVSHEDFPWRVEVDWPVDLQKVSTNSLKSQFPPNGVMERAVAMAEWLDEQFGENGWIGRGDEELVDLRNRQYVLAVTSQHNAVLVGMRWS